MSHSNGPDDGQASSSNLGMTEPRGTVEIMLFESLVHHLIEKGVLTKNDALSVVGTVASVKQGQLGDRHGTDQSVVPELALLERIFKSFEAMLTRPTQVDGHNVRYLRPPLHRDRVDFPRDD